MTKEAKRCVKALRFEEEFECIDCPIPEGNCKENCLFDVAADLIESLAAELEQVTRERDAAVMDLEACCSCEVCTRSCTYDKVNAYGECADFQWRGPGGEK